VPASDLRLHVLDAEFDYADGSEDSVLATLQSAVDVSCGSDELAAHIVDWATRYHFSRLRANVVRPLQLDATQRVLDVGAGTGAIARYVGERGCDVVALEGTVARARACATRCRDLPNVETVAGTLAAFRASRPDDAFDVVLCIGALEYNAGPRGDARAIEFLHTLRGLLRPGGALVVAIENQLGLKYLLGYTEDHHAQPFLGVEGYPGVDTTRTFVRRRLRELLAAAGLDDQRWLYPFPDYKHPKVVLAEAAYERADAPTLVDALVRWPASRGASEPLRLCDDRRTHAELVGAGLGADVANSFIVVASADGGAGRLLAGDVVAYHFGSERRRQWMRASIVHRHGDELAVRGEPLFAADTDSRGTRRDGWLTQVPATTRRYVVGRTVEQVVLDACAAGDVDTVTRALARWHAEVMRAADSVVTEETRGTNPFLDAVGEVVLPPHLVDVNVPNFVRAGESLELIDDEWHVEGGVAARIVIVRALWWLAHELVACGVAHPWGESRSTDELAAELGALVGVTVDDAVLARMRRADAALQSRVVGSAAAAETAQLERMGAVRRGDPELAPTNPLGALVRQNAELLAQLDAHRTWQAHLERDLAVLRDAHDEMTTRMISTDARLRDTAEALADARVEVDGWRARWARWERRDPLLWLAPRVRGLAGRVRRAR
jgi:O-antigen biosynthesis protein